MNRPRSQHLSTRKKILQTFYLHFIRGRTQREWHRQQKMVKSCERLHMEMEATPAPVTTAHE